MLIKIIDSNTVEEVVNAGVNGYKGEAVDNLDLFNQCLTVTYDDDGEPLFKLFPYCDEYKEAYKFVNDCFRYMEEQDWKQVGEKRILPKIESLMIYDVGCDKRSVFVKGCDYYIISTSEWASSLTVQYC